MKAAARAELFRCKPLSCTISRGGCAARHQEYASKSNAVRAGYGQNTAGGVASCACRGCEVGKLHAKGQLADVELVQVTAQDTRGVKHVRRCIGCGEPLPRRTGRKGRVSPLCLACGGRGEVGFFEDEQFA